MTSLAITTPCFARNVGLFGSDRLDAGVTFPVRLVIELDRANDGEFILIAQNEIEMVRINPVEGRSVSHTSAETFPRNPLDSMGAVERLISIAISIRPPRSSNKSTSAPSSVR